MGYAGLAARCRGQEEDWKERVFEQDYADAIALLRADHRTLEQLLAAFGEVEDARRRDGLAREIGAALSMHLIVEREIFYPAFRGLIAPARARYDAHEWIGAIDAAPPGTDHDACIRLIAAELARHALEEEELPHGLFARCRASGEDLVALRDRMMARMDMLDAEADRRVRVRQPDISAA